MSAILRYIVISPVKDEERHVEHTLRSMTRQTVQPLRWVIVNDGSRDDTAAIIKRYASLHEFMEVLTVPPGQPRQPGGGVVRAFNIGYEAVKHLDFDLVVKLDCDLSFEPDYFQRLIAEFSADPRLGIASGVYEESPQGGPWETVIMPTYHAAGASKVVRRACFEEIGGFVPARGWDTVDEIRAIARKWRTTHFPSLVMRHWKPEGSGIGNLRTAMMHGEIYYLTGGGFIFFLLKVLNRMKSPPLVAGGMAMLWGYFATRLRGNKRLVSRNEARHYRTLLKTRITQRLRRGPN